MLAPRCPSSQGQLKLLISILLRVGVATRHTPRKIATHRTSVCAMRFSGEIVDPARSTWKSIGRTARSDGVSLHASSMVIVLFCVLVVHKGCSNLQRYVWMGSCCMVGVVCFTWRRPPGAKQIRNSGVDVDGSSDNNA